MSWYNRYGMERRREDTRVFRGVWVFAVAAACTDAPPTALRALLPEVVADPAEETGCAGVSLGPGRARAKRVTCVAELPSGVLAMGRMGDVLLENALVRYVLRSGDASATTIGAPAGGVVDAAVQGGGRVDGVKEVLPVLNLYGLAPAGLVVVRAGPSEAVVRAEFAPRALELIAAVLPITSQRPALRGVLEYALRADDPVLRVRVCAVPDGVAGPVLARPGLFALLGGAHEVLAPGVGVLAGEMASAMAPVVLAESPTGAYGAALDEGPAGITHALTATLVDGAARVSFGAAALRCVGLRFVAASTAAEVALALAEPGSGRMLEVAVPAGGRAELRDPGGRVVLRSREAGGRVRARVGDGAYGVRVARAGGAFGDAMDPPPVGTLVVAAGVRSEALAPVRITVRGMGSGMNDTSLDMRFVVMGEGRRVLPAGRYRVSASRGGEYTLAAGEVEVAAGGEARFAAELERVVDTRGYVAGDFHLHTELSTDSLHAVDDAVRQMAGEGLEVVAGTDHDFIPDHASVAQREGVAGWLVAVPGEEVSTTRLGHFGGYPLRRDVARAGAGAVPWFGLAPGQIFRALRERGDDVVVQVNHPRLRGSGFFDQIGLEPGTARALGDPSAVGLAPGADLGDLSFDVVEVWNGYTRGGNERSFGDALALRAAGRRFTMVGNSDSHRADRPPGAPRSYVRVPDDGRGRYRWEDVRAGLRGGDVSVSAGIYVEARTADGVGPGGRARAPGGRVVLHVRVQAPPWADVARLRVYRGTEVILERAVTAPRERVVRFDEDLTLEVSRGGFVVVRADGVADAEPVFGFPPFGVSGPIDVSPEP